MSDRATAWLTAISFLFGCFLILKDCNGVR